MCHAEIVELIVGVFAVCLWDIDNLMDFQTEVGFDLAGPRFYVTENYSVPDRVAWGRRHPATVLQLEIVPTNIEV